jgi:hypothetical protein
MLPYYEAFLFHVYCEGMRMIYLHPKFHEPSSSGLLVIIFKLKVKENILLFYILQKHCRNKSCLFFDGQFMILN